MPETDESAREVAAALKSMAASMDALAKSAARAERHALHTARMSQRIYDLIKLYIETEEG